MIIETDYKSGNGKKIDVEKLGDRFFIKFSNWRDGECCESYSFNMSNAAVSELSFFLVGKLMSDLFGGKNAESI